MMLTMNMMYAFVALLVLSQAWGHFCREWDNPRTLGAALKEAWKTTTSTIVVAAAVIGGMGWTTLTLLDRGFSPTERAGAFQARLAYALERSALAGGAAGAPAATPFTAEGPSGAILAFGADGAGAVVRIRGLATQNCHEAMRSLSPYARRELQVSDSREGWRDIVPDAVCGRGLVDLSFRPRAS